MSPTSAPNPKSPTQRTNYPVGGNGHPKSAATRLARVLHTVLGPDMPVTVHAWDGSHAGPPRAGEAVTFTVHSPRAARYILAAPNQLGLARAYITGELTIEGDLEQALVSLFDAVNPAHPDSRPLTPRRLLTTAPRALPDVAALWGLALPPRPPAVEAHPRGRRHSRSRDAAAIRHHYDVSNDFYRLLLGPSMTYSCAYWTPPHQGLEEAQTAKHDLVAAKLSLEPGQRVLDIGCGWGSFLIHAATRYGTCGVGVTLSEQQAALAQQRVRDAGIEHLVTIKHLDYRELTTERFDAIASVGMAEHVGTEELDTYARRVANLLAPGGRLLHHTIAARTGEPRQSPPSHQRFISSYVFPDGQLQTLPTSLTALERTGLEIRDVQALREHYPPTLRAWTTNLHHHWDDAVALIGMHRARVWELYLTVSAIAFDRDRIGVNQTLAVRPTTTGDGCIPAARPETAWDEPPSSQNWLP